MSHADQDPVLRSIVYDEEAEPAWWGEGGPFEYLGAARRDFRRNIKRTWPIIVAFVVYMLGSATLLHLAWGGPARGGSWPLAVYDTWTSTVAAGYLWDWHSDATSSAGGIWLLSALNSMIGFLFFGYIVWVVTQSLHKPTREHT
jgi:hypothetical protein